MRFLLAVMFLLFPAIVFADITVREFSEMGISDVKADAPVLKKVMVKTIGFAHGLDQSSSVYGRLGAEKIFCVPHPDSDEYDGVLKRFIKVMKGVSDSFVESGRGDEPLYTAAQNAALVVFVCPGMEEKLAAAIAAK